MYKVRSETLECQVANSNTESQSKLQVRAGTLTNTEIVAQRLREMILGGELPAGKRVQERDIAETFGVSRTPVRVALGMLEADGLVEGHPNRGFTVCEFTVDDILSAYDVRAALEGLAIRTAMEEGHLAGRGLEVFEESIAECEDLLSGAGTSAEKLSRWTRANEKFHLNIIHAAHRSTLSKVYANISRMPLVSPATFLFTVKKDRDGLARMEEAHVQHKAIYGAVRKGQSSRAEGLMVEHGYTVRDRVREIFESDLQGREMLPTAANVRTLAR